MLFQLPSFLIFFCVFVVGLLAIPRLIRMEYVIAASLFFYAWWYPPFLIVMLALICLGWAGSHLVARDRRWLALAIAVALIPLLVFKYMDFVLEAVESVTGLHMPRTNLPLPITTFY